jgi:hypothetical protein
MLIRSEVKRSPRPRSWLPRNNTISSFKSGTQLEAQTDTPGQIYDRGKSNL